MAEPQKHNLHILVTSTPHPEGYSFGITVIKAMGRCLVDKPDDQIAPEDLQDIITRIPIKPQIHELN